MPYDLMPYLAAGRPASYVQGLDPMFAGRLGAMFAAAPAGIRAQIASGFRSPQRQAEILTDSLRKRVGPQAAATWQNFMSQYGDPVAAGNAADAWLRSTGIRKWVAPPGKSEHQQRMAVDLSYANPQSIKWFQDNAQRFGLVFPLGNENWHIEPIGARAFKDAQPATTPGTSPQATPIPSGAPGVTAPSPSSPVAPGLGAPDLGDALTAGGLTPASAAPAARDPSTLAALFQPSGYQSPDTASGALNLAKSLPDVGPANTLDQLIGTLAQQRTATAQKAAQLLPAPPQAQPQQLTYG